MHYTILVYETESELAARTDPKRKETYWGAYRAYTATLREAGRDRPQRGSGRPRLPCRPSLRHLTPALRHAAPITDSADLACGAHRSGGGQRRGTVATPFGGVNAKSVSGRPVLTASFVNRMVTVFSNWSYTTALRMS